MFDSALCQQGSPTGQWTRVSHGLLFGLSHRPGLLMVVAAVVVGLPWVLRRDRWKKPAIASVASLFFTYITLTSPLAVGVGSRLLTRAIPPDSGEQAAAIVVLGRGWQQNVIRTEVVAELWRSRRAPVIFPSGRGDALVMAKLLDERQIPAGAIAGEPCSLTTNQNAAFTAAILWPQGIHNIILVTDPLHMLRSMLTFESFGFEVIAHRVPLDAGTNSLKRRFLVFRETVGLLSYGLMGRYLAREVPPVSVIQAAEQNL